MAVQHNDPKAGSGSDAPCPLRVPELARARPPLRGAPSGCCWYRGGNACVTKFGIFPLGIEEVVFVFAVAIQDPMEINHKPKPSNPDPRLRLRRRHMRCGDHILSFPGEWVM
jgi:hypothetical protein